MAATSLERPRPVRRVCFITGCDRGGAHRYRCHHPCEQLALEGIAGEVLDYYRDPISPSAVARADIVVLHRVAWEARVKQIVEAVRSAHHLTIFDTDDLVFEPGLTSWVRVLPTLPPREVEEYHDGVRRYLQTLEAVDGVTTSTPFLAAFAERRGKRTFVHRNALCAEQVALGEHWWQDRQRRQTSGRVVIGYFSGTNTHDQDFQEAAAALALILDEFPQVLLRIGGHLNLPRELEHWKHRIERVPYVDWRELPELLSATDINLAPLEEGNPYCRAKSEVKYFEAGAVGVPTAASRVEAYQGAIRDGDNGVLASGVREWHSALRTLVQDAGLRREIGERSRADVLNRYTPTARAPELVETLAAMQEGSRAARAAEPEVVTTVPDRPALTLNWIVPEPFAGSGGHRNIFRMVRHLSEFGHRSRVYVLADGRLSGETREGLAGFVERHFGPIGAAVHRWGEPLRGADAVIATHWTTAYLADGLPKRLKKFYFVQDFEPYFYPVGSEYVRAENTYRMAFSCITLGSWLARFLQDRYGLEADAFDFAVDEEIYFPRGERAAGPPTVVFYARRSTPRRGFELGQEALIAVKRRMPEARVVLFGEETLDPDVLPFPYTNAGVLSPQDLAALYSRADVGLVLSLTNCSLIPLELMACKCAVVDLKRETVEGVLVDQDNALLAEPSPEAIAECVARVLKESETRQRLVDRAFAMVRGRTWERSARQVEEILLRRLDEWKARTPATLRAEQPDSTRAELLDEILQVARQQQTDREMYEQQLRHAAAFMFLTRRSLPYRLYAAGMSLWRRLSSRRSDGDADAGWVPLGEVRGRKTVGQSFVAGADHLNRIDVMIGTYARVNTRRVYFHLRESVDAPQDLVTVSVDAWQLRDQAYHSFRFPAQVASRGRRYYFALSSPESIWKDAVTVWARSARRPGAGPCYRNGRVIAGEVVFRAFYQGQDAWDDSWSTEARAPTPWWRLPARAIAEARRVGALAAARKIQQYLQHRLARR